MDDEEMRPATMFEQAHMVDRYAFALAVVLSKRKTPLVLTRAQWHSLMDKAATTNGVGIQVHVIGDQMRFSLIDNMPASRREGVFYVEQDVDKLA